MIVQKDNLKKEFGNNLKLGSLRLGKGFLHVSSYENCVRAGLMVVNSKNNEDTDMRCYYYCEDVRQKKFLSKNGVEVKKIIESTCRHILKPKALD